MIVVPDKTIEQEVILGFDIVGKFRYVSDENGYTFMGLICNTEHSVMNIKIVNDEYDVPPKYKKQIDELVKDYNPKKKTDIESPVQMKIILLEEKLIQHSPSRVPHIQRQIIKDQVQEWIDNGIVRPSISNFCSRVVVVDKKDGSKRVCVDFRDLNRIVQKDRFPVPIMEEIVDEIRNASVFSTIDMENAFFHVPIEEESRKYTAFTVREGIFEFNRAPFGFCNSPAVFLRLVNHIFRSLINESIMQMYMDDIIVYANTEEENLSRLKKVFNVAAEAGLRIKWKKCKFLQRSVTFLGLKLENGNVTPDDTKIVAVKKFPTPRSVKDVQSFLGLTGYFRKFLLNYAIITAPLTALLKKEAKFEIGVAEQAAIEQIKGMLTNKPILKIFSPIAETQLHCDASATGFGAILMQKFDNKWHPVYYWSKKCGIADKNKHSYFLEIKAAYLAIKRLKHYLLGKEFTLITDCEAFKSTVKKADLVPAVARMVLYLQDFSYRVEHRKAATMRHVDALSRNPIVMKINHSEVTVKLRNGQQNDEYLKTIRKILATQPYDDFKLIGDVLYKQRKGLNLIVIPKLMENEIIRSSHEKGHYGAEKTQNDIEQNYFIPHLRGKVEKIIGNCVKCILHNKKLGRQEGYLQPIEKGDRPLSDLHLDHLGPMDATAKNYKYVLTIVDGFSKFVWLYPVKSTTADETIKKLGEWTEIFGAPHRIITDRGTAFTATAFREFCEMNKVEHILITVGVPRANGQAERINRTVLNIISKVSAGKPENWYKHVGKTQRTINSTVNKSTKYSPFELMFGVKMKNELDLTLNDYLEEELREYFISERDQTRDVAKQQITKAQKEYKDMYDKKRKAETLYRIGELVAIKRTQFVSGKKLASSYLGPYQVIKCKRHGRYDVEKIGDGEGPQKTSTSCDYMKPWNVHVAESDLSETDQD